jgi:S-adenosylmethionine uptake transporter
MPQPGEWPDIAAAALLATVSLMLLAWAYARAEAQILLPIEYTAFIWAALMGWLWFGEALTPGTLAGVVLIVGGCWIATRSPGQTPPG